MAATPLSAWHEWSRFLDAVVRFLCLRYKLPEDQVVTAVEAALQLVNMHDFMHRATHTLSGGQRQRVAIAGAQLSLTQQ